MSLACVCRLLYNSGMSLSQIKLAEVLRRYVTLLAVTALVHSAAPAWAQPGTSEQSADEPQPFNGQRAYDYLKQVCDIGPRPSGSNGMKRQQELLTKHFESLGAKVTMQQVPPLRHPLSGRPVPAANLGVQWNQTAPERILLCAHYDTRPFPDMERDPRLRQRPFIGANDGGSGVALLMELGHHMPQLTGKYGVDFVFFDAEEFIFGERGVYFIGSEFFAREYVRNPPAHRYVAGILLDMVGDKRLSIAQEGHSRMWPDTRPLVKEIWAMAVSLGIDEFQHREGPRVRDDHLALRNIGRIPTIDIIDFEYPDRRNSYWHTTKDVVENCSAESLGKVGLVVQHWLRSKK